MPNTREHLERQSDKYRRNLHHLESQIADAGGPSRADVALINAADEARSILADIEAKLAESRINSTVLRELDSAAHTQIILSQLQSQSSRIDILQHTLEQRELADRESREARQREVDHQMWTLQHQLAEVIKQSQQDREQSQKDREQSQKDRQARNMMILFGILAALTVIAFMVTR